MEKKSIINVDGRFYYGWVMLICGFMREYPKVCVNLQTDVR